MISRPLTLTCASLAVFAWSPPAMGQVSLIPGSGAGAIDVQQGDDLVLQLFLQSTTPSTSLSGAGLIVSVVENNVAVLYDGTGSVFPGGLSISSPLLGDQDLNVGAFSPASADDTGTDLLGTLTIESSSLLAGDQFTIDFAGTILSDGGGAEVQSLPNPVLVNIVPEPASLAMLGVAGVLAARRRR